MDNNYFAIIITYQPNVNTVRKNVENLKRQGFSVVLIDNGSKNIDELEANTDTDLVKLKKNYGIAAALNRGMEYSEDRGATWVLSLDQDTLIADNILDEYIKYLELDEIGALSPRIIKKGMPESDKKEWKEYEVIEKCPTSGFFIKTDVWREVGKYDEWMFIDYVDYDICIRMKIHNYKIYRVNSTYIVQELGKVTINKGLYSFGKIINIPKISNFAVTYNHSPFRNYYYVRNCLYYINKYRDNLNVKYEKKHLIKWEIKKIVLEPNKIDNIRAIIRGVKDYRKRINESG